MLIVPLEETRPGMKLAMTVTHPEHPEQELLRRNFVLDDPVLAKMRELAIPCVYIDYPGLEDLDKHLAPNLSTERQAIFANIKSSMSAFERAASPTVSFGDYYTATRDFVTLLMLNGRHPIYLDELSSRLGGDAVRHSTAVAHLALVLGIKLESYLIHQRTRLTTNEARDVVNLGVAGMLHDLGKTKLPEKLRDRHSLIPPVDPEERRIWECHCQIGYDMIHDEVKPTAASAVLHHHQHFDGSGFPQRDMGSGAMAAQDGQRIHVFARILLAADLYDRLAVADDGTTRRSNLEILNLMRTRYEKWIDPQIMTMLPKVVPPFPPGSKVTLSDGRKAVVMIVHPEDPYRPTVRSLGDDGWTLSSEAISLLQLPDLRITAAGGVPVDATTPPSAPIPSAA